MINRTQRILAVLLVTVFLATSNLAILGSVAGIQTENELAAQRTNRKWMYDDQDDTLVSQAFFPAQGASKHEGRSSLWKTRIDGQGPTEETSLRLEHEVGNIIRKSDRYYTPNLHTNEIVIIETHKFAETGRIDLGDFRCVWISCSRVENPFIYAFCEKGRDRFHLLQIDTEKEAVVNNLKIAPNSPNGMPLKHFSPTSISVSPDGQQIIFDPDRLFSLQEDPFQMSHLNRMDNVRNSAWKGPAEFHHRFVRYIHTDLYDLALNYERRALPEGIVDIHPTRDLYAKLKISSGRKNAELQICSYSNNKTLHSESMEFETGDERSIYNMVMSWRDGNRLVIAYGSEVRVFDVSDLVRDQPLRLSQEVATDLRCELGTTTTRELSLRLPAEGETEFSISSGPETATINGGEFSWTPAPDDVGLATVEITAKNDQQTDRVRFDIDVWRPFFEIDEKISDWMISPDGKMFLGIRNVMRDGTFSLFLHDVGTGQLTRKLDVPKRIRCVAVLDRYLFVFYHGKLAERFDLQNEFESKTFETPNTIVLARPTRDGQLQVLYEKDRGGRNVQLLSCMVRDVVDVDSLKIQTDKRLVTMLTHMKSGMIPGAFTYLGEHYLQLGARIYDIRTNKVVINLGEQWLPTLSLDEDVQSGSSWYSFLRPIQFENFPVKVELDVSSRGYHLSFSKFGDTQTSYSLPVLQEYQNPKNEVQRPQNRLVESGNAYFCRIHNRIYRVGVDPAKMSEIAQPMTFSLPEPNSNYLIFPTDQVIEIPLSVDRSSGDVQFSYSGHSEHVSIDGDKVIVDAPAILQEFIDDCRPFEVRETSFGYDSHLLKRRQAFLFDNPERFLEVTGHQLPADRYQFQFQVLVQAEDAKGQVAVLRQLIILLPPKNAFQELLLQNK